MEVLFKICGEEFELGHRILKSKKKNYLTKKQVILLIMIIF